MNPRFAPAWTRHFLNADKGGECGGGAKALTIPELTAKLKESDATIQKLTGEKNAAETAKTEAEQGKATAVKSATELQGKLDAAETAKTDLQAKLDAAETAKKDLQAKLDSAETAKAEAAKAQKSAEDAAEVAKTKANETAAKAGLTPPYSSAVKEEGEKQSGDDSAKTPRERLAAFCKVAGE